MARKKIGITKAPQGINLNQLADLAKTDPKYTKMYLGLQTIDKTIKSFVTEIIEDIAPSEEISSYFIKTELMSQCYSLYLYYAPMHVIVGVSWPLADFLEKCGSKKIEMDLNTKVRQMILKFKDKRLSIGENVNWIY